MPKRLVDKKVQLHISDRTVRQTLLEAHAVMSNELARRQQSMTLNQQRLLHWAIAQIPNPHQSSINDPLPVFRITCQQFAALTGISEKSGSLYTNLKETVGNMQNVKVAWWDEVRQKNIVAVLAPTVAYKDGEGVLEFELNGSLKPHLLNLKSQFSRLPLAEGMQLKSGYALHFYLYCISWYGSLYKEWEMTLDELCEWLNLEGPQKLAKYILKAVITPSKKELNKKCRLSFKEEPQKIGRKIVGWKFRVVETKKISEEDPGLMERMQAAWNAASKEQQEQWFQEMGNNSFFANLRPTDKKPMGPFFALRLRELLEPSLPGMEPNIVLPISPNRKSLQKPLQLVTQGNQEI